MDAGEVRVFSFGLEVSPAAAARLDGCLAGDELDASPSRRVARAGTRLLLAEALATTPEAVAISRRCEHCGHPTHGRPRVVGGEVSFSLSHSGASALVAIADGARRVGVDLEAVRHRRALDALAARVLNAAEHADWLTCEDGDGRLRAFLRVWTAKEALLKARGTGIPAHLRETPTHAEGWHTGVLDLGPALVAALAVDRTDVVVVHRDVTPFARSNGGTAH